MNLPAKHSAIIRGSKDQRVCAARNAHVCNMCTTVHIYAGTGRGGQCMYVGVCSSVHVYSTQAYRDLSGKHKMAETA